MHSFLHSDSYARPCTSHFLSQVPQPLFYTASAGGALAGQLGAFGFKPAIMNDLLAGGCTQVYVIDQQRKACISSSLPQASVLTWS